MQRLVTLALIDISPVKEDYGLVSSVTNRGLLAALAVALFAAAALPAGSGAGNAVVERHPVYGGADAVFGNCPDVPIPPAGTTCTETYLNFLRTSTVVGGGNVAPPQTPWSVYAETNLVEWDGSDDPVVTLLRWGFIEELTAAVDTVHLQSASLSAEIPMSDGSTYTFSGTWQAESDRVLYGSNGPDAGFDRLYTDRCTTFVALGHQKYVLAHMTGTLNGAPVQSYTSFPAGSIFNNRFLWVDIAHGGCN